MENKKSQINDLEKQINELTEKNNSALLKLGLDAFKHNRNESEGKYKSHISTLSDLHDAANKNTVFISAAKKWGLTKLLELISHTLTKTAQPV